MIRQSMNFQKFKERFIDGVDGYSPVYAEFIEDDDSNKLKIIKIDFICNWRLPDGKLLFLKVPYDTEEEFFAITEYLEKAEELLHISMKKNFETLFLTRPE